MPSFPEGTLPLLIPSCVKKLNLVIFSPLILSESCSCLGNGSVKGVFQLHEAGARLPLSLDYLPRSGFLLP